jgi:hypothetical protein
MATCSICSIPLPNDGFVRQRQRQRKCTTCRRVHALKKMRDDPAKLLHHRIYNFGRKIWPKHLLSIETVRQVMEACESRSVISEETDSEYLRIVTKVAEQVPTSVDDFVIITKKEVKALRHLTPEQRAKCFLK